jgi:hypothetical protein
MISKTDTPTSRYPPCDESGNQVLPTKREESCRRKDMKGSNKKYCVPVDLFRL